MLSGPFCSKDWIGAISSFEEAKVVMLGVGFDGTCCNVPGSRFAPPAVRLFSWAMEDYSPVFDKTLDEVAFYDAGDLELSPANVRYSLDTIKINVEDILKCNKKYFGIGGEHSVTYPAIEAYYEKHPDLAVIQFDAHTDLRNGYLEEQFSHASVMYNIGKLIGFENIKQIGIRSGLKEEFDIMKKYDTFVQCAEQLEPIRNKNIFITVDVDVLSTAEMPGTGTQEAGGLTFNELINWFKIFKQLNLNIVGADVVELAPNLDSTGASTAVCAKIIRELLMIL